MVSTTMNRAKNWSGPRALDLRRDLKQVATLVEEAFGDEMDAPGRAALRELQLMARFGPYLNFLIPAGSRLNDVLDGFVWVEQGEIVGNVTLQRLPKFQTRFLIANVAVRKTHQGRGIARELMRLSLEHIVREKGEWVVLQVRETNDIARGMYQRLGFTEIMTEHRLQLQDTPQLPNNQPLPPGGELRQLDAEEWPAVRQLLQRTLPREARWWHPGRSSSFREGSSPDLQRWVGRWLGFGHKMRWGLFCDETLMGVLDVDVLVYNEHRVDMLLHPDLRKAWSGPLLVHALRYLQRFPARPVNAILYDYQKPALAALNEIGFRPTLTLVNMRKRVDKSIIQ